MRLLLVNGNRTEAVTERAQRVARGVASASTIVTGVTARFGADYVRSRAEETIAAHAVLDALAQHAGSFDAAVLAISLDSGLLAARQLLPVPVVGMTEAALHVACQLAERIAYLSWYRRVLDLPVQHDTGAGALDYDPEDDCLIVPLRQSSQVQTLRTVRARKVVLANGIDAAGAWLAPPDGGRRSGENPLLAETTRIEVASVGRASSPGPAPQAASATEERLELRAGRRRMSVINRSDDSIPHTVLRRTLTVQDSEQTVWRFEGAGVLTEHPRCFTYRV